MPHADFPFLDCQLYRGGQLQQTQIIRNRRSLFTYPFAQRILCQVALVNQTLVRNRNLDSIQILPLDIFNQCQFKHGFFFHLTDISGNSFQPCHLRCPEPAFPGNNLVLPVFHFSHGDGLHDTDSLDRRSQLLQSLLIENGSRLVRIRANITQFQFFL